MKAKITKNDTVIELEGTPEELGPFIEPKPQCPGVGDKESIGKLIDELMKGAKAAPYQPPSFVYNDMCPMGGCHDYPTVWMSITPPACLKCGRSSGPAPYFTVLCTQTISGELGENGTYFFEDTSPRLPFISAFTIGVPASQS